MVNSSDAQNLMYPKPCRKKVDRMWVKQALGKFVGACGAAATAAVVSVAVSQSPLQAQEVPLKGDVKVVRINAPPASQPASQPATQASQLTPQQKTEAEKLVAKLDADDVATRDAATKQLKEMGQPVVAFLKDISAKGKLSCEASARVLAIIETLNPSKNLPKGQTRIVRGEAAVIEIQVQQVKED